MTDTAERPIKTTYIYPPIPTRRFDWQAVRDGWDLGEPVGMGQTEADAVADLLEQEEEQSNG